MAKEHLGAIFKRLRIQRGLVLTEVEKLTEGKITTSVLSRYENGASEPFIGSAWELAKVYHVSLDDIMAEQDGSVRNDLMRMPVYRVPLLSSRQIMQMSKAPDSLDEYAERPMVDVVQPVTVNAYAFVVEGDQMTPAAGMGFPEGFVVIADPGVEAQTNDFVLARTKDGDVLFRQLSREMDRHYLRALNRAYGPVNAGKEGEFAVLGVIVGATWWSPTLRNSKFSL